MTSRLDYAWGLSRAIGPRAALDLLVRHARGARGLMTVTTGTHQLSVRPGDSDFKVLTQIFGFEDYDIGAHKRDVLRDRARAGRAAGFTPIIIDAGANIGCSALYLARLVPEALVIAIEVDRDAFALLEANCAGEAAIRCVNAALWRDDQGVLLIGAAAQSWAHAVEPGGDAPSCTLESLLAAIPNADPLMLKLDIEGAEREVCEASAALVAQFPCILVEPHDFMRAGAGCLSPLYRALAHKRMDTVLMGENLLFFESDLLVRQAEPVAHAQTT